MYAMGFEVSVPHISKQTLSQTLKNSFRRYIQNRISQ